MFNYRFKIVHFQRKFVKRYLSHLYYMEQNDYILVEKKKKIPRRYIIFKVISNNRRTVERFLFYRIRISPRSN